MQSHPFSCRLSWILAAGLMILMLHLTSEVARAQLDIGLELDKKTFMTHEPITGVLTMVNRAGREIVLDGPPSGGPWLDFHVIDGRQHMVTPVPGIANPGPLILPNGAPHKIKVMVNHAYPMTESGMYRVKVRVYFPPLQRYFETRIQTVNIVDGQPMWGPQVFGVPAGFDGAGTYRAYTLLTFFQGTQKRSIYFRLSDNDTGRVRTTYSLGEYMMVRPPEHAVDAQSQLHVLHMAAPQQYFYTVIQPSGKVLKQVGYREKGLSRPELVVNPQGDVAIRGGVSVEEMETPYEEREFRKLSERPPGMPVYSPPGG
ncbi:MAG: hypothetical protein KDN20_10755 [Verrucomicrobiae bacterium]|nr:hypothetical protein [Verrucomicrobiae bacterium]